MLVVGTPRPSSMLGEVADNGFFEKSSSSRTSSADDDGFDGDLYQATPRLGSKMDEDLDDLWNNEGEDGETRRGSRSRSESFHEMYDEKAKSSPIVLSGDQPLLTRQLNIVTNLSPTTYEVKARPWGSPTKEELAEEELLEREEMVLLERWRSVGGRGKPDLPGMCKSDLSIKKGKKKSLAASGASQTTASSALVPSAGGAPVQNANINNDLLPRYEDKVQLLVLMPNESQKANDPIISVETIDFPDIAGRRAHCVLWRIVNAICTEDTLLEAYLRGCDALCLLVEHNEWSSKWVSRALALERPVIATEGFGASPAEAKKNATRLNILFDAKGSLWAEMAVRDVVLRSAKIRTEAKPILALMEKQLKRTEKGKPGSDGGGGSSCTSM